jgi:cbb3-type cytochrome oxidase maturation protein
MSGLAVLIPIAVVMGLLALIAFLWAVRSGQYEDLDGASERIFEEDLPPH